MLTQVRFSIIFASTHHHFLASSPNALRHSRTMAVIRSILSFFPKPSLLGPQLQLTG